MRKKMLLIFFISGACGLIYQVLWVRMLGLIFGNTTYAVSTVLAAYMAGLALGSWRFGKRIDGIWQRKNNLKIFGYLMLGIGVYCIFTPLFFGIIRKIYVLFGATQITTGSILLIFLLSFIMILIPTTLMGGTLPVLTKWFAQKFEIGYSVGILYSVNTWGAVIGAFLTGYVLIMILGVKGTLYLASAINITLAGVVFLLSRQILLFPPLSKGDAGGLKPVVIKNSQLPTFNSQLILIAVAISGFTALTYEVVWTRVLSMVLGSSVYAFATMLCAFLAGIALGSIIYAKSPFSPPLSKGERGGFVNFGYIQAGIGVSVLLLIPIFGILPMGYLKLFMSFGSNFAGFQFMQFLMAFGVMIIPTTLFGMTIPLACKIISSEKYPLNPPTSPFIKGGKEGGFPKGEIGGLNIGSSVGNVYAANTMGAILGSILAGFALIPLVGLQKTITIVAMVNVALAIILLNFGLKERKLQRALMTSFLLFFSISYVLAIPEWNKNIIASGIYNYVAELTQGSSDNIKSEKKMWKERIRKRKILFYKEGAHFTVSVTKLPLKDTISLQIDGKTDASSNIRGDMTTQILSGHLPLILHRAPENALIVGLASGVTLGAVTRWKNLKEIDCVEIEPVMVEASHFFDKWNNRPLEDKRVDVIINDVRNYLLTTKKKYDVIISEPSNPWMSGCAPLFTQDYFTQIESRLAPNGIFCMWLQGYRISPENYNMVINTLNSVFRNVSIWEGSTGDTLLIAGNEKLLIDFEQLKNRISYIRSDLEKIELEEPFALLVNFIMGDRAVSRMTKNVCKINSDEHPYIEFAAGKEINLLSPHLSPLKINNMLSENMESVSGYIRDFNRHYELAGAYLKKNNYPRAEKEIETSIKKSIKEKESYNLLGYSYLRQGNLTQAKDMFKKTIAMNPEFTESYVNLSQVYLKEGNLKEAEGLLKDVIRIKPRHFIAYNNLGDIYSRQGKYDKAVKHFEKAIEINPRFAMPYVNLGIIYLDRKDLPEKAKAELLEGVKIVPVSAMARYHLGRAYLRLNQEKKAVKSFNRAMALDPKYVSLVKQNLAALNLLKKGKNQ